MTDARTHTAWLLWCISEGYENAEDRAGMTNWLEADPATLHDEDALLRPHLLAMADEVLALMKAEIDLGDSAGWQAHDLAMGLVAALQSQRVEIRAELAAVTERMNSLDAVNKAMRNQLADPESIRRAAIGAWVLKCKLNEYGDVVYDASGENGWFSAYSFYAAALAAGESDVIAEAT